MAPTWDQLGDAFKDNDKVGQRQHRRSLLPACESQRRGARRLPPLTLLTCSRLLACSRLCSRRS